jgi:hypothetical protein
LDGCNNSLCRRFNVRLPEFVEGAGHGREGQDHLAIHAHFKIALAGLQEGRKGSTWE